MEQDFDMATCLAASFDDIPDGLRHNSRSHTLAFLLVRRKIFPSAMPPAVMHSSIAVFAQLGGSGSFLFGFLRIPFCVSHTGGLLCREFSANSAWERKNRALTGGRLARVGAPSANPTPKEQSRFRSWNYFGSRVVQHVSAIEAPRAFRVSCSHRWSTLSLYGSLVFR